MSTLPTLPDAIPPECLSRVLVMKLGHLGDVLLASPVPSVLKRYAPQAEIDALVYTDTAAMLSGHPDLRELFTIDRDWRRLDAIDRVGAELALFRKLRARHYDLVVYLSHKPRGAWLARFTDARYAVTVDKPGRGRWWKKSFTHFYPIPRGNTRHTVEIHLDALRRIGIFPASEERRLSLATGSEAELRIEQLLAHHALAPRGFIHIHPASRWQFKCWPMASLAALIKLLQARGERIVITAAPDPNEAALIDALTAELHSPVINLAGQLSLKELGALVARAKLFVGVDSVPMHMAAAMQTPVVALFGPSGEVEWAPWQTAHRVVVSDHSCRPCGINGCGGSNRSECMEVIEVARVLEAIDLVLAETGNALPRHRTLILRREH